MFHQSNIQPEWKLQHLLPFNELILSWNGIRPLKGKCLFYVSVKIENTFENHPQSTSSEMPSSSFWSSWLLYASWGCDQQKTFFHTSSDGSVKVFQDTLEILNEKTHLHLYTNGKRRSLPSSPSPPLPLHKVYLHVAGLSQMNLNHPRNKDLCSPTSTTAALRYLLNHDRVDPLHFAMKVWDSGFDIFGNWILNIAQASVTLGKKWLCWVERLNEFADIHRQLIRRIPVVVSVKGPLKGGALPYTQGHLMSVIGYDPTLKEVICIDPAFCSDDQTEVHYDLSDFIEAWNRRGNIAYLFLPVDE